ncbi:MAG: MerR family transcriptional regulator, repressor of the yfmOP operon [Solirubrobacteraceae bacterium]|jgi:DNA-binding transcriptional MerR regulator|nr:MerR family transcriptional regulator, repressor of the yfmOP operon [Solirubrobacteraceae bacterium]
MTAVLRIGEAARRAETTVRTIRYYEEIGLLPAAGTRESGAHRVYSEQDVERLRWVLRVKELLGLSLEELKEVVEGEELREVRREEYHGGASPERRHELAVEGLRLVGYQLDLVARRQAELDDLRAELTARRDRLEAILRDGA